MFKVVDPIIQSILFVYFIYGLSMAGGIPYRRLFYLIVGVQMISVCVNIFIKDPKLLKKQRLMYAATMGLYLVAMIYFQRHVKETFFAFDIGLPATVPLHGLLWISGAMLIAFWYGMICYTEIKSMWGAINRGNGS
jgi:hypothetical protein